MAIKAKVQNNAYNTYCIVYMNVNKKRERERERRRRKISKLQNKPVSGGNRLLNEEGRPSWCLYIDGYRLFHILKSSFSQSLYSLMHRMLEDRRETPPSIKMFSFAT